MSILELEQPIVPISWRVTSAPGLYEEWSNFVDEVAAGYAFGYDDYLNDLAIRDLIERLVRRASVSLRSALLAALAPIDARSIVATGIAARQLTGR